MTKLQCALVALLTLVALLGCRAEPPDTLAGAPVANSPAQNAPAPVAHPSSEPSTAAPHDADHAHVHDDVSALPSASPTAQGPAALADEPTVAGEARGIQWAVPRRWPLVGEENEFRVRTWRLPALSMAGAGECVLFRFPGGGDPQDNLRRWMGQFRGPDGTVESVAADQAQRVIHGLPAWLVRAQGTYVSQGQTMEGPEQEFPDYGLFGAVIIAEGDPAFVKCTGPLPVIAHEANAILALIDSLLVAPLP